jgi:hypothetical protein|nr:MAG TPA: hypothetical protein [Caudoviricetes sp.]
MLEHMKELYFDEPIQYKDLLIYPVQMKDYLEFHWLSSCLLIDKNSIPDINIISMSYLNFLYYMSATNDEPYIYMVKMLLCMVLHMDFDEEMSFYVDENDKAFFKVRGIAYDSSDFDEIVKIIFEQNCITPIDNTIQKEVRDALQKAEEFKMQQTKQKMCSLEEQMICVLISTPLKLEDIYELTIRKFEKILRRVDAKLHYQIYLSASMSGMVKFKDENAIKHWMNDLTNDDRYADVKVDMDTMRNKIESVNQ